MGEVGGAGTLPFSNADILLLVKGFYVLGLFMYLLFAAVMIRQADMMLKSVKGLLDWPVRLVVWIHMAITLALFGLAVLIL